MTAVISRRSALSKLIAGSLAVAAAASLGGCGRRGNLELPGETPAAIGGPTPPNLPPRQPEPGQTATPRRDYDRYRPTGQGQILPSGQFILDPLL